MDLSRRKFLQIGAGAALFPVFTECAKEQEAPHDSLFVKVLGITQDGGLPQLGCDCERCTRARQDPRYRRFVASLGIVTSDGRTFLVDATPDIREQLAMLNDGVIRAETNERKPVDGIFLTHAHMGHYTGLAHLGFESISAQSVRVYCSGLMGEFLAANAPWDQLVKLKNIELRTVAYEEEVLIGLFDKVQAAQVRHRQEYTDTLSYIIRGRRRSLLYIPDIDDWEDLNPNLAAVFNKYDIVVIDGTFYSPDELPGREMSEVPHPLITTTMGLLKDKLDFSKTEIYFTHFNHTNPVLDRNSSAKKMIEDEGFHCA
ncbi:MBL fold metallo-hydrolase, partial [candidate division KSB1 bacterium]